MEFLLHATWEVKPADGSGSSSPRSVGLWCGPKVSVISHGEYVGVNTHTLSESRGGWGTGGECQPPTIPFKASSKMKGPIPIRPTSQRPGHP